MKKEEFVKEYKDKNEIEEISMNTAIKIDFEVTCDSNIGIQDGNSIAKRVIDYLHDCIESIDESMRHWGDHEHCIEAINVTLQNIETGEEEEVIDLLDEFYNPTLQNYYYKK